MHPRNPYADGIDFGNLAQSYPELDSHLKRTGSGVTLDFQDPHALRALTQGLLRRDFDLRVELPDDRLCPPVPNRLNYVLWIEDIVNATAFADNELGYRLGTGKPIRGADIGTGASAIYPLLACRTNPKWVFNATDVDEASLKSANYNVAHNDLQERILVLEADPDGPVFAPLFSETALSRLRHHSGLPSEGEHGKTPEYDFTMCNPPFYSSQEEINESAEMKELGPRAACTGGETEMITPGGEVAFVRRMITESTALGTRCTWYTSMLGKMSSVPQIISTLRENDIDNYVFTELTQGQTRRWAIGWSFKDIHLPDSIARVENMVTKRLMPPRSTIEQVFPDVASPAVLKDLVRSTLDDLEGVDYQRVWDHLGQEWMCGTVIVAQRNTWSRKRRRMKEKDADEDEAQGTQDARARVALMCRIDAEEMADAYGAVLKVTWMRGYDRTLFESFASHVARKVRETLASRR